MFKLKDFRQPSWAKTIAEVFLEKKNTNSKSSDSVRYLDPLIIEAAREPHLVSSLAAANFNAGILPDHGSFLLISVR